VTKITRVTIVNSVTPKAGAKHELLFNKPALGNETKLVFTGNNWFFDILQAWYVEERPDHSLQNSDLRPKSEREKHREEEKTPETEKSKITIF
jgi:hypothetical protein